MKKILLVDDDHDLRELVASCVVKQGWQVIGAPNTAEAEVILRREGMRISLIILDINMPRESGLEFLKRIKTGSEWVDIPIMMFTSNTDTKHVMEAVSMGVRNYLLKPFKRQQLIYRITQTIQ